LVIAHNINPILSALPEYKAVQLHGVWSRAYDTRRRYTGFRKMADGYTGSCLRFDWIHQKTFLAFASIVPARNSALPNTEQWDNWYSADREHCIFESGN